MTCPKCGSGVADGASQCGICFFNLEQAGAQAASDAPLAFRMPVAPTVEAQDEPVAGIPGIDNHPGSAPLGGGPAPLPGIGAAPLPGAGSGQFKVSLTGEMIEVPSSMPTMSTRSMDGRAGPPSPSIGGNGAAPHLPPPVGIRPQVGAPPPPRAASSMPPRAGASARRISPRPAADEYAGRKSGAGAVIAVVAVLLLGGGAAGWFFWQKTHSPQAAVSEFFAAVKAKDAKKVLDLVSVPPEQKALATEALVSQQLSMLDNFVKIKDVKVGDAIVSGDSGTVKVTLNVTLSDSLKGMAAAFGGKSGDASGDKSQNADIPVVKVNGAWKINGAQGGAFGGMAQGFGRK